MKINDVIAEQQVDELSASDVGQAAGKATRAVGSGIKNFAKGFASGVTGKDAPTTKPTPAAKSNPTLDPIKASIAKLNPKQLAALRTQIAKKAGVV